MKEKIRLILVDDYKMVIQGFTCLLEEDQNFVVIGEARSRQEVLKLTKQCKPDIVLMGIQWPTSEDKDFIRGLAQNTPESKVIVVGKCFSVELIETSVRLGAHGFIPKNCDIAKLIEAIYLVKKGGNCFSLSYALINEYLDEKLGNVSREYSLSKREMEVLKQICMGKSNKQIAASLNIVARTVEFHKTNIYAKTGLKGLSELITYGIQNELR